MNTAQCVFAAWLILGAVVVGVVAGVDEHDRLSKATGAFLVYLGVSLILTVLVGALGALGQVH